MQISPKEFRQLANDVDDMQRDSMRTFHEEIAELHFGAELKDGRRSFLKKVATGGAALTIGSAIVPISSLLPAAAAQELDDVSIAVFAESVELAAVAAYEAVAAQGVISDEVLPVAQMFISHHQEHAAAFGSLAGDAATGTANAALVEALLPTIQGLADQTQALEFAQVVENQAVVTYAFALGALASKEAAAGTASILPVESAHASVIGMALGQGFDKLFPNGAFESANIADGIDPSAFPVA